MTELKFDGSMKFSICKWSAGLLEIEHQYPWFEKLCIYDLSKEITTVPPLDCPTWNPLEDWSQCMMVRDRVVEMWESTTKHPGNDMGKLHFIFEMGQVQGIGVRNWNNGMVAQIAFADQNQILHACYLMWEELNRQQGYQPKDETIITINREADAQSPETPA